MPAYLTVIFDCKKCTKGIVKKYFRDSEKIAFVSVDRYGILVPGAY
ncbi:hypothetical protein J2S36_000591 [Arcanobacterium hippocoleae]|uniref:Uncharacterized protein n=1 Tax=Arcanobacterium hippocoleae TaxID=149017 RepID=A0ABU1T121_9ACTO|nr:hypothetical protein [Arcanobacterium hippocoleae]